MHGLLVAIPITKAQRHRGYRQVHPLKKTCVSIMRYVMKSIDTGEEAQQSLPTLSGWRYRKVQLRRVNWKAEAEKWRAKSRVKDHLKS